MAVRLSGRTILLTAAQLKAYVPMISSSSGKINSPIKEEHPENASEPISLRLVGK